MTKRRKLANHRRLTEAYLTARERVIQRGFAAEVDWQESRHLDAISETEFLREAAWVVLSAGMSEVVIRKHFPRISSAFLEWVDAKKIVRNGRSCQKKALRVFNHTKKIQAILSICKKVAAEGFERIKRNIQSGGVDFLQTFAYVGSITRYHLAKNIGIDVVKPDRHLTRVAQVARFPTPAELCQAIADTIGERLSVVDLVIWRYATLDSQYLSLFRR